MTTRNISSAKPIYIEKERSLEKEQVEKILAGDEAAQEAFCLKYRRRLMHVAMAFLGHQDPEVEDMAQETLITGLNALGGFQFKSSLYTWLNRICANLCLTRLRERQRLAVRMDQDLHQALEAKAMKEGALRKLGQSELLRRAMDRLQGACQKILRLRHDEDLSYGAISEALKIPIGTVMSRLARCRELARAALLELGRGA